MTSAETNSPERLTSTQIYSPRPDTVYGSALVISSLMQSDASPRTGCSPSTFHSHHRAYPIAWTIPGSRGASTWNVGEVMISLPALSPSPKRMSWARNTE